MATPMRFVCEVEDCYESATVCLSGRLLCADHALGSVRHAEPVRDWSAPLLVERQSRNIRPLRTGAIRFCGQSGCGRTATHELLAGDRAVGSYCTDHAGQAARRPADTEAPPSS